MNASFLLLVFLFTINGTLEAVRFRNARRRYLGMVTDTTQLTSELHINGNRIALIQRDIADKTIKQCKLYGSRFVLQEIANTSPRPIMYVYDMDKNLNLADFTSVLKKCEQIQFENIRKTRKSMERSKELAASRSRALPIRGRAGEATPPALIPIWLDFFDLFRGIYPGTKWCGVGNIADDYNDLGRLPGVDTCCREHDRCPTSVPAHGSNRTIGLNNDSMYTKSHCDCDEKFLNCLKSVNNEDAGYVGWTFFDVLQMECYKWDYPYECLDQSSWIGIKWCNERGLNTAKPKQWYFSNLLCYCE